MCGLTGFLTVNSLELSGLEAIASRMALAIEYRGPDDAGAWADAHAGIALGHRRLSIVDLSAAGRQPMASGGGRYVIAFNGEIYNHLDLRKQLGNGVVWRGHSDTETLLAGFDAWGIEATVKKCIGMFAFAVWCRQTRTLTLGRDRLGEKPLYYGWQGAGEGAAFLFGSELKALKAHPAFRAPIDRGALSLLLRHNYIPAPHSIYEGIAKLPPGCLLTVSLADRTPRPQTYWSGKGVVEQGLARPFAGTPAQAVDALEALLKSAVRQQMVADVPLGAFLSGGVDSSTIVALMQAVAKEQGGQPVKTFTIGFNEAGYNEAEHAKAVARHLGTDHTELYVSPQQALDVIPMLPGLYCEPFADSSQIPTFLVSQMARQHVTVSLSGDAGDELFGGYNRYVLGQQLWSKLQRLPVGVRRTVAGALTGLSPAAWNRLLTPLQGLLPKSLKQANIGDKLHKGAGVMAAASTAELYRLLVSHWTDPAAVVIGGTEPLTVLTDAARQPATDHFVHEMMALDMLSYLPDDILCKVDRAAMGVSLETRVPLLDHRVVEFAWSLPLACKLRNGVGKWPLREVLYRHVPRELIERPKMGFGIPLDDWLRGPLRGWAEELLGEQRLRQEGYFHPAAIRQKWAEHLSGQRNWAPHLWTVLMFQAWLEQA
ncbi:MAG: asparagine synthase (glutamine-hydrolyzing) [Rhodoferax sp.]|nr:asparagine synthase (glutamine-hydrolyzing) [Rhodoferax sp.]